MKIFDLLVEKSVNASARVMKVADTLHDVAHQLHQLAINVHHLAKAVHRHEILLGQLMQSSMIMMQESQEISNDLSLPDVEPAKVDKPN